MSYEDFIKDIKKVKSNRKHKFKNSYGVRDAFLYYRKIRPKEHKYVLTDSEYYHIIRAINNRLRDSLIQGKEINLPERMGVLELRKMANKVTFEEGRLITNRPIDWNATLNLWYTDSDCFDKRQLVKTEDDERFKIYYNKSKANYNNKMFYKFKTNRYIKLGLKENIKKHKIDAFKYGL